MTKKEPEYKSLSEIEKEIKKRDKWSAGGLATASFIYLFSMIDAIYFNSIQKVKLIPSSEILDIILALCGTVELYLALHQRSEARRLELKYLAHSLRNDLPYETKEQTATV